MAAVRKLLTDLQQEEKVPTCERLDARALEESGRAVLIVPVVVPAVVDRVAAAVLLLQLHVVVLGGQRRHHDLSPQRRHAHIGGCRPSPAGREGDRKSTTDMQTLNGINKQDGSDCDLTAKQKKTNTQTQPHDKQGARRPVNTGPGPQRRCVGE